jgi:hypothetical protein
LELWRLILNLRGFSGEGMLWFFQGGASDGENGIFQNSATIGYMNIPENSKLEHAEVKKRSI